MDGSDRAIGHIYPEKLRSHIARLDPTTVRELVRLARIGMETEAVIKAQATEIERLREALEPFSDWMNDRHIGHYDRARDVYNRNRV